MNGIVRDFQTDTVTLRTIKKLYDHIKAYPFDSSDELLLRVKNSLDRFVLFIDTVFQQSGPFIWFRPGIPRDLPNAIRTVMTYSPIVQLFFQITSEPCMDYQNETCASA